MKISSKVAFENKIADVRETQTFKLSTRLWTFAVNLSYTSMGDHPSDLLATIGLATEITIIGK